MPEKRLPRSVRKFLRRRKAEIRRQFLSSEEAEAKIQELVEKVFREYTGERVVRTAKAPGVAKTATAGVR